MKKYLSLVLVMLLALSCITFASAEDVPVITILCTPPSQCLPMTDMTLFNDAAKNAGVSINWIEIRSGWTEKKAVTLADKDLPDIFMGTLNNSDILANKDLFVDMTELINEYAPNIQRMYDECPAARISGTYDGAIYSLPLITAYMPRSFTTLNINKVWLDKLGLDIPETIDDLEAVMLAFRDGDPNGNGIQDEIGFDWPPVHGHGVYALAGAWGIVPLNENLMCIKDGEVSFLFETEAFKELTTYINHWYQEGLITPEVYTNDYTASNAICASGEVARVGVSTGYSLDSRFGQFASEYICIPQLSAGDEYERLWPCSNLGQTVMANAAVMTKSCEDPVSAIKLLDQFYSEDFSVQSYYGSFDTGMVTKYDDGTYSIQLAPESGAAVIDEAKYFYSLVNAGVGYFSTSLQARTNAPRELTARLEYDNVYAECRPADTDIWPSLAKFTEEDSEELTYLQSDIMAMVNQKIAKWVVNGGIDDEWDDFQESLKAMGLEDMREIYQSTYDNYMSQL